MKFRALLFKVFIFFSIISKFIFTQNQLPTATINIDVNQKKFQIDGKIFGSNQVYATNANKTVNNSNHVSTVKKIGIKIIR